MADSREALRIAAKQIRDEHRIGANTATRVGSLMLALVDAGADIEELKKRFLSKEEGGIVSGYTSFPNGISVSGKDFSDYLGLWEKKVDASGQEYLFTDFPIATRFGLITYRDDGTIDLPSIYDGLLIDNVTIGRNADGALTVLSGVGSDFDSEQMWEVLGATTNEQISCSHLTTALSDYATRTWTTDKLTGYVTTSRLNELIGGASGAFDTLKEIEDYINSHESVTAGLVASLGNKVDKVSGYGLSKNDFTDLLKTKLDGIAEGANKYILPIARAAVLGGVMIGSNINVDAQGMISTHAPYELTKDKVLSVLKDADGVIRMDAHLALSGGLINYATMPGVDLPGIYDGLPIDGTTIGWDAQGRLTVIGGVGMSSVTVKLGSMAYESVDGVISLPAYPIIYDWAKAATKPSYTYLEVGTATYTANNGTYIGVRTPSRTNASVYYEFWDSGIGWAQIMAGSFKTATGTSSQLLRADGGVATFNWSGQSGQPVWLWGGNSIHSYTLYNPSNFNVYSSALLRVSDIRGTTPTPAQKTNMSVTSWFNNTNVPNNDWWGGICVTGWNDVVYERWELAGPATATNTQRSLHYRSGQGSTWGTWKTVLDSSNWTSIVDGRYLPLTGGSMAANAAINFVSSATAISGGSSALQVSTKYGNSWFGMMDTANCHIYTDAPYFYFNKQLQVAGQLVWNSGNDGAGSGLDADILDGYQETSFVRSWWTNNPGYDCNTYNIRPLISFTYSNNAPFTGTFIDVVSGNGYGFYLGTNYAGNSPLYYKQHGIFADGGMGEWQRLARITDNVASSTKLQTARLIWGQLFDGTGNVSGKVFVDQQINVGLTPILSLAMGDYDTGLNWQSDGKVNFVSNGVNCGWWQEGDIYGARNLIANNGYLFSTSNGKTIQIGSQNSSYCYYNTNATGGHYFNTNVSINGTLLPYNSHSIGSETSPWSDIWSNGWYRTKGNTGIYFHDWGGGFNMIDSVWVRTYNSKRLLVDNVIRADGATSTGCNGFGVSGQFVSGIEIYASDNTFGIGVHSNDNIYFWSTLSGSVDSSAGKNYLGYIEIGNGQLHWSSAIVLHGAGLVTFSSDMRLKNIKSLFAPTLHQLADLPIFSHTWNNGTPGVQLSTSAQAVRRLMPWNVMEGSDGYLTIDGTRTALAVSIRLAQLANEYIIKNDAWKDAKDRQIEELQREIIGLKRRLNGA